MINFYTSGTTTRKTTYKEINQTIPNANPVVLTGDGRLPNDVYFDGVTDATLTTSSGTVVEVKTNIGGGSTAAFSDWNVITIYASGNIVIGSNGNYYVSLQDANQGNDPTASGNEEYWHEMQPTFIWNTNVTYAIGDIVQGSDDYLYVAVLSQSGNNPVGDDGTNWKSVSIPTATYEEFLTSGTFVKNDLATFVYVECVGGGGAGGNAVAGSGGSGGGFASGLYQSSELTSSEAVTIGAGGVNAGVGSGPSGGDTTFGTSVTLTADGGIGGDTSASTTTTNPAGSSVSTNADGNSAPARCVGVLDSGYGGGGGIAGGDAVRGGAGGGSSSGSQSGGTSVYGGNGGAGSAAGAAGNGVVPGGGGGGSGSNTGSNGGDGANGRVRVWQW